MPERKTVTRQTLVGEGGISLIGQMVNDMGHLWHPRRVDHGIDGHIDLVDPATKTVLNTQLLVQSKASDLPFPSEDDSGFHYLCDQRDLDLWLGGNAPVILVLSHPKTREAWWVDIRSAFPDARSRAARRVDVDKARDRFDASTAQALMQMGKPRDSGLYFPPTPRPETLTTNLLEIVSLPPSLFIAKAVTGSYREAGQLLRSRSRYMADAWILTDGLVVSFSDLRDQQWEPLRAGDVEEIATCEWTDSPDTTLVNQTSALISRTIQNSHRELRWHKDERHVHFTATADLTALKVGRRQGKRGRTVFKPHRRSDGVIDFYAHAAAGLRPRRISGRWHVEIMPDWCFTKDGWAPTTRAGALRAGIKRLERHPAVSGWLTMWAGFLYEERDLFSPERPIEFGELLTLNVEHGINDALWGPAPGPDGEDDDTLPLVEAVPGEDLEWLWTDEGEPDAC